MNRTSIIHSTGAGSLRERLLRGLARERVASTDQLLDVHALPREERIETGHCIDGLRLKGWEQNRGVLVLHCPFNVSKFRAGDKLRLGDGTDPRSGVAVVYLTYDPAAQILRVEKDRWSPEREGWERLDLDRELALDRADSDFGESVLQAVRMVFDDPGERFVRIRSLLERSAPPIVDPGARLRAEAAASRFGLDVSQREAFAAALSRSPFHMVQGPPGSGKTRLIASLLATLSGAGERILVTAYTHRAVNNALRCLHALDPAARAVKIGEGHHADDLPRGIDLIRSARGLPPAGRGGPSIVGATVFALKGFWEEAPFGWVIFDEAAQIPIPHAVCGMLAGRRYVFVGDHKQLGPIVVGDHEDELPSLSIFAHLAGVGEGGRAIEGAGETGRGRKNDGGHEMGGRGEVPSFLSLTYRMNSGIADFPSRHFYEGRLEPAPCSASRRFAPVGTGPFDELWDPSRPVLLALISHEGHRTRCRPEAALVADLVTDYLVRQNLPADELAVVTPYRAQIREIRNLLKGGRGASPVTPSASAFPSAPASSVARDLPVIDTVERMQGQEREALIVSLVCSEPEYAAREAEFYFSLNRLNVTLTRARTKLIVIASPLLFQAVPPNLPGLRGASLFARMYRELPKVDLSARYLAGRA